MKRLFATLIGTVLAAGLAFANPASSPEDLATRYFAADDEAGIAASWKDWHPEAVHTVTIRYGLGTPDDQFSYSMADWESSVGSAQDPALVEAMRGYEETARTAPELSTKQSGDGIVVTAVTRVDYTWHSHAGQMTQTDRFTMDRQLGSLVIRGLETTYDYR